MTGHETKAYHIDASESDLNYSQVLELVEGIMESHGSRFDQDVSSTYLLNPDSSGLDEHDRRQLVERARVSAIVNPVCKQVRNLWTNYGIGAGLAYKARSRMAQTIVDAVIANPKNKNIFSPFGQRKTSNIGLTDGELFIVVFGTGAHAIIRRVDSLTIEKIATDPNDKDSPLYYIQKIERGGKEQFRVYPDWTNADLEPGMTSDGDTIVITDADDNGNRKVLVFNSNGQELHRESAQSEFIDAPMHHWLFDGEGQRGLSLFSTMLDWCKAQQMFMRDRIAITRAIAMFAWKMRTKGGDAAVNTILNKFNTTMTNTSSDEDNPRPTGGSMYIGNNAADLKPMPQETGADSARIDGDMIMNMAGLGGGVFAQYLGRGDLPNYAMANSMEGPMVKQWEAYQEQLEDLYRTIFRIVLRTEVSERNQLVDVEAPELIRRDTPAMLDGFTKLLSVMPGIATSEEVQRKILGLIGIDHLDIAIGEIQKAIANAPEPETQTDDGGETDGE